MSHKSLLLFLSLGSVLAFAVPSFAAKGNGKKAKGRGASSASSTVFMTQSGQPVPPLRSSLPEPSIGHRRVGGQSTSGGGGIYFGAGPEDGCDELKDQGAPRTPPKRPCCGKARPNTAGGQAARPISWIRTGLWNLLKYGGLAGVATKFYQWTQQPEPSFTGELPEDTIRTNAKYALGRYDRFGKPRKYYYNTDHLAAFVARIAAVEDQEAYAARQAAKAEEQEVEAARQAAEAKRRKAAALEPEQKTDEEL